MRLIKIEEKKEVKNKGICSTQFKTIFNNCNSFNILLLLLLIINTAISSYLFIENKENKIIINELLDFKNSFDEKKINLKTNLKNNYIPYNDKEMIGLHYPDINFNKIKASLKKTHSIYPLIDLINQLEIKLIYIVFRKRNQYNKINFILYFKKIFFKGKKYYVY